jgi:hypothetical protein
MIFVTLLSIKKPASEWRVWDSKLCWVHYEQTSLSMLSIFFSKNFNVAFVQKIDANFN